MTYPLQFDMPEHVHLNNLLYEVNLNHNTLRAKVCTESVVVGMVTTFR